MHFCDQETFYIAGDVLKAKKKKHAKFTTVVNGYKFHPHVMDLLEPMITKITMVKIRSLAILNLLRTREAEGVAKKLKGPGGEGHLDSNALGKMNYFGGVGEASSLW